MKTENKTPIWFWIITVPFTLLAISGLMQINSIFGNEMTEPIWAKLGYIIGIIGMFIGSIFLCLRKKKGCFNTHYFYTRISYTSILVVLYE